MSVLNTNIPYIKAFVRNKYLVQDINSLELTPCYIFGAKALTNNPLAFHCQLDNGAVFFNLPLSAFCLTENFDIISTDENIRLSMLEYWDMQSSCLTATVFTYLKDYPVECYRRDKKWVKGTYLFTIDDYFSDHTALPTGYANDPDGKCFHIIAGSDGNLYAYPNNYLRWHNLNFVTPYKERPAYRPNTFNLKSEYVTT